MKTKLRRGLLLGVLVGGPLSASQPDGSAPGITIRMVNSAKVARGKLTQGERIAAYILGKAGISVTFQDCFAGSGDEQSEPCTSRLGATEFWLHVALWKPATISGEILGFASLGNGAGNDTTVAGIYYPMVKNTAERYDVAESAVLGATLVHEIGHLLGLGHSPMGVMRRVFGRNSLILASRADLLFSEPQAEKIRQDISRRRLQKP